MVETTARLALPFIMPGQAQKEVFHNEALARLDIAVAPAIEGAASLPPTTPAEGQAWIVGSGPEGTWAGHADALACWTTGGWRFVQPVAGMLVWSKPQAVWLYWSGTGWSSGELPVGRVMIQGQQVLGPRLPAVPSPSGGTTIDAECRAAVDALIATFKSHGMIE